MITLKCCEVFDDVEELLRDNFWDEASIAVPSDLQGALLELDMADEVQFPDKRRADYMMHFLTSLVEWQEAVAAGLMLVVVSCDGKERR